MYTNCSFAQNLYAWKTINDTQGVEAEFGASHRAFGAYVETLLAFSRWLRAW
jgi:hypothetical protein